MIHKIIHGHYLLEANVIVTTRSSRSTKWKNHDGQHIEILGFSRENARAYMKILNAQLSTPVLYDVEHLMTSPLNCNILAYISSSPDYDSKDAPLTMTQIYTYYIGSLIANHFLEKEERSVNCESLENLPEDIKQQFIILSKLAYDGISRQEYSWFNYKLPDNFQPMGLMNLYENCNGPIRANTVTYCFKDIIQEYLAAFYMHINPCDGSEHQRRYGFSLVLQFLSGLQGTCEIWDYQSSDDDYKASDDDNEENGQFIIRETGGSRESDEDDVNNSDDNGDNSFVVDDENMSGITEKDEIYDEGSHATSKYDLDDTLVDEDIEGESQMIQDISNLNTTGEEIASPVLNQSNHEKVSATKHYMSQKRERDSDEEDTYLRALKRTSKRSHILDSDTECSKEQESLETSISESFGNNNDSSVQTTLLSDKTADDDTIIKKQTLLCIFEAQNMKGVPSSVIYEETKACLKPNDSFKLGFCISQSKTKWTLHLSSAGIIDETLEAFAEGVRKGNSRGQIVELNLDDNHFETFETLCCIPVKILSSCKEISLVNCFSSPPIDAAVIDFFSSIKALTTLDLSNNNLTDDKAENLIRSLISCKHLQSLKLKKTNIGVKSQHAMCTLLSKAKSIRHLDISNNTFHSVDGMKQLCMGIKMSTSLLELDISDCSISSEAKEIYLSENVLFRSNLKIVLPREWQ